MNRRTAIKWSRNPWLAALLLVAFFSRALIPIGFMPGPGGLILCLNHAYISHSIDHDMSGMAISHQDDPRPDNHATNHEIMGVCPFAAAASTAGAAQSQTAAVLAHFFSTAIYFPPQQIIPRGTIVPTRLPRGPPPVA